MLKQAQKRIQKQKRKKQMNQMINKLKEEIKKEDEYIDKCEKYEKDINFINSVPISFDDELDVSAKTINGEIFLNGKLFDDDDWNNKMRYMIHEITHVMQQDAGQVNGKTDKNHYLDDKNEQEAFQAQISYMSEHDTPEEIQKYLEQLLDHHNIKGKERKEKIKELTKNI